MRAVMVALLLLGAACKKKPGLVDTPVSQLDPLGGGVKAPVATEEEEPAPPPQQPLSPATARDGGAPRQKVIVAPRTTDTPSVASPYVTGGGKGRLPLWKQRAKFY